MAGYLAQASRSLLIAVAVVVALVQAASAAPTKAHLSEAERQKIEALIVSVAELNGAVFVRNGKEYAPSAAAKFLRAKWQKQAPDIASAEEFVVKVATASSTTGRVYMVRFADGREMETSTFLRTHLAAMR